MARREWDGIIVGWTRASIPAPFSFAIASNLIVYPNSFAKEMSSWSISRIPWTKISFGGTCPPVASQTRIASLCAVSIPSTSNDGSASASPAACASARTSANGLPSLVMRERM